MALNTAATHSYTTVPDSCVASAQHGVAVQPKRLRARSCTSEACRGSERPREQPGAIYARQNESHTTQGVSTAHRRLFNTGLQPERLSLNRTLGDARCSAAEAAEHSAHTCNCVKVDGAGRGGASAECSNFEI